MLHQLDAKGHHRDNQAQQEDRIHNPAKMAAQKDLTSLDNRLLHEAQMQGQHLEKYLKYRMYTVCFIYKDTQNTNINGWSQVKIKFSTNYRKDYSNYGGSTLDINTDNLRQVIRRLYENFLKKKVCVVCI